jgi:hypothetical protein
VFDAAGVLRHNIEFPLNFELKAVRGDIIAGILTNADGSSALIVQRLPLR